MIRETDVMDRPVSPGGRRSRLTWVLGGIVALAALALAPRLALFPEAERSVPRSQLRYAAVDRGELVHDIGVEGRVVAASRPTLYSRAGGIVTLRVSEGQRVEQGQEVAVIDSPSLTSQLEQEQASLAALQSALSRRELAREEADLANRQGLELMEVRRDAAARDVKRLERLAGEGLVNELELETARDTLRVVQLELAHAEENLVLQKKTLSFELEDARLGVQRQELQVEELKRQVAELSIRAPFQGLVATVEVEDRDAVLAGQPLLGVVDLGDLEVEVAIPESSSDETTVGIAAVVLIEGREVPGTLTRIAPEVRAGQVVGRVTFDEGVPQGLRQNQRLSTRLVLTHRPDVVKVPRGPFLEAGGGRVIYVVHDDVAHRTEIRVGAVSVSEVEITEGLTEGDVVVLSDLSRFDGASTIFLRS